MSYILEALRKSEGERDTGRVPDLASRHDFPDEALDARRPLWPYVLAGVFSLNVAVLAYVFWPKAPVAAEKPLAAVGADKAEAARPEPAFAQAEAPAPAATPGPAQVLPPAQALPTSQNPPQAYGQAAVAPAQAYGVYPPAYAQAPAYGNGYPPAAYPAQGGYPAPGAYPVPAYAQPGAYPAQAYPAQAMPQPGYAQAPIQAYPPAPPPGYGAVPAQTPAQPLPELADGETLVTPQGVQSQDADSVADLHQLPQELQAQVPAMEFSTHVYSSNPAKSFVVINGQTYGVGAQVFPGLLLEAIVEDAVVFNRMGQRFRLEAMKNWPNG